MGPTDRTLEIASALASGASTRDVMTRYGIGSARVRQIRAAHVGEGRRGAPTTDRLTPHTAAGRAALEALAAISAKTGRTVSDLLVWLDENVSAIK